MSWVLGERILVKSIMVGIRCLDILYICIYVWYKYGTNTEFTTTLAIDAHNIGMQTK